MFKFQSTISWIKENRYLVLILLVAALLRFGGTNPGYSPYHSDEPAIYGSALEMVKKSTLDPGRYDYPATAMLINALFYKFFFIPISWVWYYLTHFWDLVDGVIEIPPVEKEANRIFTLYIAGERGVNALFWARYVTAFFSLGSVFLVYLLGKNLWKREVGLIAALFLALNFRHVLNSHISLPDIYNSFFLLLSLLASLKLWKSPTRKNYLLAGLAAGISFSIKYQIHAALPLVIVHLYISFADGKFNLRRLFNPAAVAAALVIPVVFMLTNPYYLINFEQAMVSNLDDFRKYGMGTNKLNLFPLSYLYHVDIGPPLFFTVWGGVVLIMLKDWRKLLFLCSALIYFFFVFTYYSTGGFYVRNVIPVTPVLLLFAAYAVWSLIGLLKSRAASRPIPIMTVPLLLLLVFIPGRNSVINSYYNSKEWNYTVMGRWLRENLPSDVIVAATPFDVPKGPKTKKTEFELSGNFSLAEHKEAGATWALMNLDWAAGSFYFWMNIGLDNLSYWNKPVSVMRNTYHGLAAEELFRYQVHSVTKPWQAPDANLILAKIPEWPEVKMKGIKSYDFENDEEGWKTYLEKNDEPSAYQFDSSLGRAKDGSLAFSPGVTQSRVVRISLPVDVKEGHLYKVTGYLKTDKLLRARERDGFLRVDFYEDADSFENVGKISSISSRVYGTTDWIEKEIIERAPMQSSYMVVSFQVNDLNQTKIWLDDIEIYESEKPVEDITSKPPYRYKPIDLNNLYPFSHGNL